MAKLRKQITRVEKTPKAKLTKGYRSLRFFNDLLSILIFCLAIYIIITPFLPELRLRLDQWLHGDSQLVYQSALAQGNNQDLLPVPEVNTLVIPKIGVNGEVYEGADASTLELGIWRRPNTSTPDQGGNTVIVAHRFMYTNGPKTFYHLDKLEDGDKIQVYWEGQEYIYQVYETEVVAPTAVEVEDPSDQPILTLYTCTPLWTAKDRLVVRAKLIYGPDTNLIESEEGL
ncbi:class E sortase [Candidatus Nomurabacteria bacterium]|nr:class E sortase [Candidatus Nomurabacteria bacterium]